MRDKRMSGLSGILAAVLIAALAGCVHPPRSPNVGKGSECLVVFPTVALARGEYIQSFELDIRGGRLSAVNRFLEDWSYVVDWDYPGHVLVRGQAGHFPAGLATAASLSGTFVIQADADECLRVAATLATETVWPAGAPEPPSRAISIAAAEMILIPTAK